MEPIVWTTEIYDKFIIERAKTGSGDWTVSQFIASKLHRHLYNEARIKFQPTKPEGLTATEIMARIRTLDEKQGEEWSQEKDRLFRYISPTEIGYAHSLFEARKLVEMLEEGDAGLAEPDDAITAAGFKFAHEMDNWRGHFRFYGGYKNLEVVLATDEVHLTLNRGSSWYNLMSLQGDHLNDHQRLQMIEVQYPAQVENFRRVGVRHAAWVIENRLKRGGQLREPLTEEVQ